MGKSVFIRIVIAAFAVGCFAASSIDVFQEIYFYFFIIMALLILVMILFWRNEILRVAYSVIIAVVIGIALTGGYINYLKPDNSFYGEFKGEGIIVGEPVQKPTYQQLIVRVNPSASPLGKGRSNPLLPEEGQGVVGGKNNILVKAETYPIYNYGDKIEFSGDIDKVESFETDQGKIFDYPNYLLMKFKAVGIVKYPRNVKLVSHGGNPIVAGVFAIKRKVEDTISQTMPEPQGALDQGLLTGTKINFTKKFEEALRRTGTSHIVAISGFNITIILAVFFHFMRRSAGYWPAIISGILAVILFTILTGGNASIVRASIMGSLGILAVIFGRQAKIEHTIFIAAGLMILLNPLIVRFDAGFQLSFLAVLGLIYFSPKFDKWFGKIPYYEKLPKAAREAISATFGAQLMTWPVLIILFSQISIIAPLVNAILLPFVPITMALGFGAAVLAMIIPVLGNVVSFFPWLMLTGMVKLIEGAGQLPLSSVAINNISPWVVVGWFVIVIFWINQKTVHQVYKVYKVRKVK